MKPHMAGTERRGVTIFKKIQKYCNDLLSGDTNRVGIRVINNPGPGHRPGPTRGGLFVVDLKRGLLGHAAQ